jgi:hypothetical protein
MDFHAESKVVWGVVAPVLPPHSVEWEKGIVGVLINLLGRVILQGELNGDIDGLIAVVEPGIE